MVDRVLHYDCNKEKEITEIQSKMSEVHVLVKEMHKDLNGNGQPGIVTEFNQWKGAMIGLRILIGGGGVIAIVSLIMHFI